MEKRAGHDLWYKDAIIYELHVKAFCDSNGDGRGDFRGLIRKLDYLEQLGVTAIWLLPFYPSPQRDDGYDIADYRGVHADYGSLGDFKAFVREAHRRNLKVITELVINHTSDQHRWFQAARRAKPGSARREFYVWSDTDRKFPETRIIFTDTETSNWNWDPVAGAYYWHRFSHQPDLNLNNPRVVNAVGRVLRFWLDTGVDGLRLDAVPYLCVREGTNNENLPETHEVIKQLRRVVDDHYDHRMLLAEANQWPQDVRPYFGDGDECHMAFHFPLMPRMFMAVRREDRHPITEILDNTPSIPDSCQWALFLRNHDELTLEMVTDEERDYMYSEYAGDPRMRVNVGIRRRLAPLLDNGRRRIELMNSLLFSFPGTPVIYYGDEIGMGDNIYLGDRDGVRTPMQWSADRNAGFSRADPARLYLPPIMDPVYGYEAINVEAQQRNPSSLLHFMQRMIYLRRQHKAFGRGSIEFLHPLNRKILAYLRRYRGEVILCVANLSRYVQPCELDLSAFDGWTPVEMIGRSEFPRIGELPYFLTLGAHAFYWFQLEPPAEPIRLAPGEGAEVASLPLLTLEGGADTLFGENYRYTLLTDVIQPFLLRQRWFQGKARNVVSVGLVDQTKLGAGFYLTMVDVRYEEGGSETYTLPLKLVDGDPARRVAEDAPGTVLARVRGAKGEGVLFDAMSERQACSILFAAMLDGRSYETGGRNEVRAFSSAGLTHAEAQISSVRLLSAEQSNTSVVVDDSFIFKLFRRVEDGPNPDLEVGHFLTEKTGFQGLAPVLGGIEYRRVSGPGMTLAMLQRFVPDSRDGWAWFAGELDGFLAGLATGAGAPAAGPAGEPEELARRAGTALEAARRLGRRTAEFHLALASAPRSPAFAPRPMSASDLQALADELARQGQAVVELLTAKVSSLPEDDSALAHQVLSESPELLRRFDAVGRLRSRPESIRCHGDFHLGQTLRAGEDFILLDFEGEPMRPLVERRRKASPLRDVAGMLRSFDYAAFCALRRTAEQGLECGPDATDWIRVWRDRVSEAFADAYFATAGDAAFLPAPAERNVLLDAFLLAKALYELQYELNNRPGWVRIPLEGIHAIAGTTHPADANESWRSHEPTNQEGQDRPGQEDKEED